MAASFRSFKVNMDKMVRFLLISHYHYYTKRFSSLTTICNYHIYKIVWAYPKELIPIEGARIRGG